jgi:hypothetical protein
LLGAAVVAIFFIEVTGARVKDPAAILVAFSYCANEAG